MEPPMVIILFYQIILFKLQLNYSPYRSTCRCVYVYDTLDVGPCSINGRVKSKTGLVDPEVCASSVHYLTLKVYLHLAVKSHDKG